MSSLVSAVPVQTYRERIAQILSKVYDVSACTWQSRPLCLCILRDAPTGIATDHDGRGVAHSSHPRYIGRPSVFLCETHRPEMGYFTTVNITYFFKIEFIDEYTSRIFMNDTNTMSYNNSRSRLPPLTLDLVCSQRSPSGSHCVRRPPTTISWRCIPFRFYSSTSSMCRMTHLGLQWWTPFHVVFTLHSDHPPFVSWTWVSRSQQTGVWELWKLKCRVFTWTVVDLTVSLVFQSCDCELWLKSIKVPTMS